MSKPVVLYVEDDRTAAYLFELALREINCSPLLFIVVDGDSAIDFLTRSNAYTDAPSPDLVILDINLPGTDGLSVLQYIRQEAKVLELPVVMFTSSTLRSDKDKAKELGASAFFHKPITMEAFWDAVRQICTYLPPGSETSSRN